MLTNKNILITGGTGSFGKTFTKMTLEKFNPKEIIIFSRDEMKQWTMAESFRPSDPEGRVNYVIGDVRDKSALRRIMSGVDIVVHAAATMIVPTAVYNPAECIKTNINGAMNVIEVAIDEKVEKIVALSTDKACNPVNLYGATKLASDKLFVSANLRREQAKTCFSVVRYGNVIGSRGSVIPFFERKSETGVFPITDPRMTRFMISIDQGVNLVWHALEDSRGGEIYIHKVPSMRITDIARAVDESVKQEIVGIRPGEKVHELMIGQEDAHNSYEYDWYYKILPTLEKWHLDPERIKHGVKVDEGFSYSSETNSDWMTVEMLRQYLNSKSYRNLQALNI